MTRACSNSNHPQWIEALEDRRLLSAVLADVTSTLPIAPAPVTTTTATVRGTLIHAEANQSFKAVVGRIRDLPAPPAGYSLHALIYWGDNTAPSAASFVRQPNGTIAVLGSHTYFSAGTDAISAIVTEDPPPETTGPILVVGNIQSKAEVITPNGGVTLNETAGVPFTAALGSFSSNQSSLTMTAIINWGDGTTSVGKILALPVANPLGGGRFEVVGSHVYAHAQSYLVHVTVTTAPTPVVQPRPTPVVIVAQFDSVIDVLPVSPIAAA